MKKLFTTLLVALVLVGCTNATATPKENFVLFTVNGVSVDERQHYEMMKQRDAGKLTIIEAQRILTSAVENEEVDNEAKEQLEKAKEYLTEMGQDFGEYLKSIGFDSEEDYLNEIIYPEYRMTYLIKEEITKDFDKLATTYAPKQMRILQFDTADNATAGLERIKNGESFADVAKDLKAKDTTYVGDLKIYNVKDTEFPTEISGFITNQAGPGLSEVLKNESTGVAYVIEMVETQADRLKDEILELWSSDQALTKQYRANLYKNAGFKVYDIDILNNLKADTTTAEYISQ